MSHRWFYPAFIWQAFASSDAINLPIGMGDAQLDKDTWNMYLMGGEL